MLHFNKQTSLYCSGSVNHYLVCCLGCGGCNTQAGNKNDRSLVGVQQIPSHSIQHEAESRSYDTGSGKHKSQGYKWSRLPPLGCITWQWPLLVCFPSFCCATLMKHKSMCILSIVIIPTHTHTHQGACFSLSGNTRIPDHTIRLLQSKSYFKHD